MSGLTFSFLGSFEATDKYNRHLHFPTVKTQALLAYLLVENLQQPGASFQREYLMTLLWPDILPTSAQTNLRQTLYRLRRTIPKDEITAGRKEHLLLGGRQCIQVNLDFQFTLDVAQFENFLERAGREPAGQRAETLSSAVDLYRGDFLTDVHVPDSEKFENWAEGVRENLRRKAVEALYQIGVYAFDQGNYGQAQDAARRQIELDELNEGAYRQLMSALSAGGQRTEALNEHARLSQLLAKELDIEPSEETRKLAESIRRMEIGIGAAVPTGEVVQSREIKPASADFEAAGPPSNLPYELNRFIGRQDQINTLLDLFHKTTTRLVTLTGPGGVGKTRLGIRLAAVMRERYPDGVWLLELAPLANPALIAQAAARTFDLIEEAGQPLEQTLIQYLRPRKLLIVLDNCEHLIESAAQFASTLLRATPGLDILATSREPLDIEGEIIWTLPPLSTPVLNGKATPDNLTGYEATDLFIERATAAQPNFTVSQENARSVAQVCTRLDGIPLAIELAAARVRALPVEEIAARLDDRFKLLVGSRTSAPRQQTLQALIDWSYNLLPDHERILMRRLAVFSGGWSLEAAEAICPGGECDKSGVLDTLSQLVTKSLVVTETQKGQHRYRFLETIRQHAYDRLEESQELDDVSARHSQYFLNLAEQSYRKLWGKEQGYWLDRLELDHDNLRKTLEDFFKKDPTGDSLLRLAGSLWRFWEVRGYIGEGRAWMTRALEINPEAGTYIRANGLRGAGILARQQGDYDEAQTLHEQSLILFRQLGPQYSLGAARQLDALGEIEQYHGNYKKAVVLHEESLALQTEIGDKEGVAASLGHLGVIARERGKYGEAEDFLEQSLRINRELEDRLRIGVSLNNLGLVATLQCHYEQALTYHGEAVTQYRDLNNKLGISDSLLLMGDVHKNRGDFSQAAALYHESMTLKMELGDRRGIARTIARQATTACLQGRYSRARELADQSLEIFRNLGIKRGIVVASRIRALVAVYEGDFASADRLAGKSLSMAEELEAAYEAALAKVVLGLSAHAQDRLEEAQQWFQESVEQFRKVNDRRHIAHTLVGLARTAYRIGNHTSAREYLEESMSLSREFGILWSLAYSLEISGLLHRREGAYDKALRSFQESLELSAEQSNMQGIANCLGAIAGLAALLEKPEQAGRIFAATDKIRDEIGGKMGLADKKEYEERLQYARSQLGEETFHDLWAEGQAMPLEQAIEVALTEVKL